jgi:putative bacteriocin precursor
MRPVVRWIDERETFQLLNNVAAQGIQSLTYSGTPIWARGLTGVGQVVGVADTVSAFAMCMCASICKCVGGYIYIYICMYMYIYIYIYIYI